MERLLEDKNVKGEALQLCFGNTEFEGVATFRFGNPVIGLLLGRILIYKYLP